MYDFITKVASSFLGYVNGKLLNLENALGRQVVSIVFSTKEGGKQNEMKSKTWQQENLTLKKQSNLITQDKLRNVARDEMNEVGNYIYTT